MKKLLALSCGLILLASCEQEGSKRHEQKPSDTQAVEKQESTSKIDDATKSVQDASKSVQDASKSVQDAAKSTQDAAKAAQDAFKKP
jgi:methyl-accepting chemotaxis protein